MHDSAFISTKNMIKKEKTADHALCKLEVQTMRQQNRRRPCRPFQPTPRVNTSTDRRHSFCRAGESEACPPRTKALSLLWSIPLFAALLSPAVHLAAAQGSREFEFECVLFGGVTADLGEIGSIIAVVHGINNNGGGSSGKADANEKCAEHCNKVAACIGFSYSAAVFNQCTNETVTNAQLNLTRVAGPPPPPPPLTTSPPAAPCSVEGFDGPLRGVKATLGSVLAIADTVGADPMSCAVKCFADRRCRAFSYRAAGKRLLEAWSAHVVPYCTVAAHNGTRLLFRRALASLALRRGFHDGFAKCTLHTNLTYLQYAHHNS